MAENDDAAGTDEGIDATDEEVWEGDIEAGEGMEDGTAAEMEDAAGEREGNPAPSFYVTVMLAGSVVMFLCGVVFTLLELMGYRNGGG